MTFLAEISDKMPTILELWFSSSLIGVTIAAFGLIHRNIAFVVFPIGFLFSITWAYTSYHDAFIEPGWSTLIQNEMGTIWIINSLISPLLPFFCSGLVFFWQYRKRQETLSSRQ